MENYIALLLLVAPGFVVTNMCNKLNENRVVSNKFEKTVDSLIASVCVMSLIYVYLSMFHGAGADINYFRTKFGDLNFVADYICLSIASIFITISAWHGVLKRVYTWAINKIRISENKDGVFNEGVFQKVFSDGDIHVVLIEQDGKEIVKGFVKYVCEEDKKDIFIDKIELIRDTDEEKNFNFLKRIKGVYYDFDTRTKITEYEWDVPTSEASLS